MTNPILILNANQLITLEGGSLAPLTKNRMSQLHIIENGAVWLEDGYIQAVGKTEDLIQSYKGRFNEATIINAQGKIVLPGLIDPHTHVVYAGSREEEFQMRLNGASYMEILKNGGGILSTADKTRKVSEEQLYEESAIRLNHFLLHGVTTVEAKSGYGLDSETELKQLRVMKQLNENHSIDMISTFMGAHAVPNFYKGKEDQYIDMIIEEILPKVVEENLAEFNDVFCEKGVFTPMQSRRILEAGKVFGLLPKIHADEIEPYGGAELAAEVGAISADHLLKASEQGIHHMAEKGIVGVLLPGTAFFLMKEVANGRAMIDHGLAIAIATDCNPGSSPTTSLPFMMNLACLQMGLNPAEAITAATINAAHAINRGHEIGSIEVGKKADITILRVSNYLQLPYYYGMNHTDTVIKTGRVVVQGGVLC
jgi:imidazolonepropionase